MGITPTTQRNNVKHYKNLLLYLKVINEQPSVSSSREIECSNFLLRVLPGAVHDRLPRDSHCEASSPKLIEQYQMNGGKKRSQLCSNQAER
ncbi:hypothetical protein FGO68_gene12461 [Halteria grandinella]|uniref:Uncharacterized protein n=1 Tax=Halteria grandinella TaxID=5974 RepID=A0A8J8NIE3_HALGN|nr:hypothetical protein FGO68_gene12461 [Halteria grandinella]